MLRKSAERPRRLWQPGRVDTLALRFVGRILPYVCSQDGRYGLALTEARRDLAQQLADISKVRDYAVSLLGLGGLAATFLGVLAISMDTPIGAWTWAAVAMFALLAVTCVVILWPKKLHVASDPATLVEWVENEHASPDQMERDLALSLGARYEANRGKHKWLMRLSSTAILWLVALIVVLVLDLRSR